MTDHRSAQRRRDEHLRALGELLGEALTTPAGDEPAADAYRLAGGGALLAPHADWTRDLLRTAVLCALLTRTGDVPHLRRTLLADARA